MIDWEQAYRIVIRAIKAIAGMTDAIPEPNDTLGRLGISQTDELDHLKNRIVSELDKEGFLFQKMTLGEIDETTKIIELANFVSDYAISKSTETFY